MKFWFVWGLDALIGAVALCFFVVGLSNGRVSSFNIGLWLVLLLGLAGVIGGSLKLRSLGRARAAMAVALVLGIPGLLCALFFLVVLIARPRWN